MCVFVNIDVQSKCEDNGVAPNPCFSDYSCAYVGKGISVE